MPASSLRERLSQSPAWVLTLTATAAAFITYSSMYAFRKPFTAATYGETAGLLGLSYKSVLVIAQVMGYMLSKFIGIKVISEMRSSQRVGGMLLLMGIAQAALLGFGLLPAPVNILLMFLNGMPLGMMWGFVFSYLEGRRQTEVMGLGLCASFIFASGFVKDIGQMLMAGGASEFWMPFLTGCVFLPPLLGSIYVLEQLPPPSAEDEALRTRRGPMSGAERRAFFLRFAPGLLLLIMVYMILTAYRDFRDNFLADIWLDLRPGSERPNFSRTETPVSVAVLGILMLLVLVKDNLKALMINHLAIFAGVLITGLAALAFQAGFISDTLFILSTGFGTYVAYIPFNSILFDRMIAAFRYVSNVGFLIYLADSFGYLGSVGVLVYKNWGAADLSWSAFFIGASYVLALSGSAGIAGSALYFWTKARRHSA